MWASDVASGNDVHCVSDVTPVGVVGMYHIAATNGSNITMSKANNITFAVAKTSLTEKREDISDLMCPLSSRQTKKQKVFKTTLRGLYQFPDLFSLF